MKTGNMKNLQATVAELDRVWRGNCKVVLGEDIGPMEDYANWLSHGNEPISRRKSHVSGMDMVSAPPDYAPGGKWMAFDEVEFGKKFTPLSINQMKDIDSLVESIDERLYYAGNIYFGNSGFIQMSSNVNDSFYIYNTCLFGNSKHLAYCTVGRRNESCFGCNAIDDSSHCIKCVRSFNNKASFELWMSQNCSSCYYSAGLTSCIDCFFCFNLTNKRRAIGNLELSAERYSALREKLLGELVEILKKKKKAPTLLQIVNKCKPQKPNVPGICGADQVPCRKDWLEGTFLKTTKILFGKPLEGGIDSYAKWLTKHSRIPQSRSSAADGRKIFITPYANYQNLPRDRLLGMEESLALGLRTKIKPGEAESISMENAHERINQLAFFNVEMMEGRNMNLCECSISVNSSNCYRSALIEHSKNCGYCFWMNGCQNSFGCDAPFDTSFCINTYSCNTQSRCFEIDCCGHCYDSYFLHNCENMYNSMFCFGVKNRRNCIGNAELPPEQYMSVKSALIDQIAEELIAKKDFKWDIYNIGCAKPTNGSR